MGEELGALDGSGVGSGVGGGVGSGVGGGTSLQLVVPEPLVFVKDIS